MNIGIIGLGFVGNAILQSFKIFDINTIIFDKYKKIGNFYSCLSCDLLFLALPTLYDEKIQEFNKTEIIQTCKLLQDNNYKGLVIIKSTVEPETTFHLSNKFKNLKILHNPEFLSAKTAFDDFHNQKHIIIGKGPNCNNNDVQIIHDFTKIITKILLSLYAHLKNLNLLNYSLTHFMLQKYNFLLNYIFYVIKIIPTLII